MPFEHAIIGDYQMNKIWLLATVAMALNLVAPASAQEGQSKVIETGTEKGAGELEAFTNMFQNIYKKDDTPIDPALLSKGERIAQAVVPQGSYRKIIAETFKSIVEPMMEGFDEVPLSVIASFAGVGEDEIKLKEGAKLSDLMMIVDPHYKKRNRTMMSKLSDIMIDLSDDIEPSIREGMAKAYARRFTAKDLEAVAQFYETESGAKIAGESLGIFASPEVMSASMEMMPQFMERFFGEMESITKGSDDLPPPRKFSDLSDEEIGKLSELMGVDRDAMGGGGVEEITAMAEELAEDLAEESAWNQPENWTAEDRAEVDRLEAEYDTAFDTYFEATEKAKATAKAKLKK